MKYMYSVVLSTGMLLVTAGCETQEDVREVAFLAPMDQRMAQMLETDNSLLSKTTSVSAIGDILIHDRVYDDARTDEGFDFISMLEDVAPYLEAADVTIANQETMIGGEEMGLSGYPAFNSPYEIGDALKDAGVDVVTLANNHTLDRGPQVIMNALDHWDKLDMMYTGSFRDKADAEELRVIESNGISIAILSYTYGTNGAPVPEGRDYLVNLAIPSLMEKQIKEANEQADAVLVALHAGDEYVDYPNDQQRDWVQLASESGATAVIGHHSHVLQPVEWVEGVHEHDMLVIYSLGNFLSGQFDHPRRVGGIFTFELEMQDSGKARAIKPVLLPTYVQFNSNNSDYRVTPMKDLTDEDLPDVLDHLQDVDDHMSLWLSELEVIKE